MSAPTPVTMGTPDGTKLKDGFSTRVAHSEAPDIAFWIKSVTPSAIDGGDPVEQKTMHSEKYETFAPRTLIKSGPLTAKVAYDPVVWETLPDLVNIPGSLTVQFSNRATVTHWGYVQKFDPGEAVDGTQPDGTVTMIVTNTDPSDDSEAGPVYTAPVGT